MAHENDGINGADDSIRFSHASFDLHVGDAERWKDVLFPCEPGEKCGSHLCLTRRFLCLKYELARTKTDPWPMPAARHRNPNSFNLGRNYVRCRCRGLFGCNDWLPLRSNQINTL